MRVAIFGAGAVGGYLGARLASGGTSVAFIARGEQLSAMRNQGLLVESVLGDVRLPPARYDVEADAAAVGPCDVVVFAVKSYDTVSAAGELRPLLQGDTAVVSLQNGIDNEELIANAIGQDHVLGGAAYLFVHRPRPGVVRHTGGPARFVLGELDGRVSPRLEAFNTACRGAGLNSLVATDIHVELWTKFVFLCALAGITTATRQSIGDIRRTPETWELFRRVMEEVAAIARAEGVALPDELVERHIAFTTGLEPGGRSSMYDDMVAGRPMELEALLGQAVRRGRRAGIETPVSEVLFGLLLPVARAQARTVIS
jgi:2-dehydropantoate 2-reductase